MSCLCKGNFMKSSLCLFAKGKLLHSFSCFQQPWTHTIEKPTAVGLFIMLFSYVFSNLILLCGTCILRNKPTPSNWVAPVGVGCIQAYCIQKAEKQDFKVCFV